VTFPTGRRSALARATRITCYLLHQGTRVDRHVNTPLPGGAWRHEIPTPDHPQVITSPPARRCSAPRSRRYEFDGQEYNGSRMHDVDFNTCTDCHATHTGEVRSDDCAERHDVDRLEDLRTIRADEEDMELVDYDGDGDVEEVCEEMRRSRKRCCGRSSLMPRTAVRPSSTRPHRFHTVLRTATATASGRRRSDVIFPSSPGAEPAARRLRLPVFGGKTGEFAKQPDTFCKCCTTASKRARRDACRIFTRPPVTAAEH